MNASPVNEGKYSEHPPLKIYVPLEATIIHLHVSYFLSNIFMNFSLLEASSKNSSDFLRTFFHDMSSPAMGLPPITSSQT